MHMRGIIRDKCGAFVFFRTISTGWNENDFSLKFVFLLGQSWKLYKAAFDRSGRDVQGKQQSRQFYKQ